jgi:hypothetical protein
MTIVTGTLNVTSGQTIGGLLIIAGGTVNVLSGGTIINSGGPGASRWGHQRCGHVRGQRRRAAPRRQYHHPEQCDLRLPPQRYQSSPADWVPRGDDAK